MSGHTAAAAVDRPPADAAAAPEIEADLDAVHVRNYHHAGGHSVHLTLTDASGRVRLAQRCYLGPGQSRRIRADLEPGGYRLAVRVDGVDRMTATCRLDASPARTAVVELGDGVVSVTEGADGLVPA